MFRSFARCAMVVLAVLSSWPAAAQELTRVRIRLNPSVSPSAVPDIAGVALTPVGRTRTNAHDYAVSPPLSGQAAAALLAQLRSDRAVLWAEPIGAGLRAAQATPASPANAPGGRKLMLRLQNDPTPDWDALLPRLSARAGAALTVERHIGNVWVLSIPTAVPDATLASMAGALEDDAAVQYADPVRRVRAFAYPNDPMYPQQWALYDPLGGVDAQAAWALNLGNPATAVAVIDTGVTAHPEFAGRFAPGYDFIADTARANDGGGRDGDPSDPGDWTKDNECGPGVPGEPSSWHGTFVTGIVAATANNGVGVAGMDTRATVVPVRVLGRCGGSFDDVIAGVLWSAGVPVAGAPLNQNPVRVINLSLGGEGPCSQAMQDAIDAVLAQGAVVVVAAGNSALDASSFAPANCSGVITVGASSRQGDRASYSNYGARLDLSAPGGDGAESDWIVSTWNDGIAGPGHPIYARGIGTSFAAPYVTGTASLMLARNANLTPGQVTQIIVGTARRFPTGTQCALAGVCGSGLLDAGLAVQSTPSSDQSAPPGTTAVIEYYRADRDHYFMTADPAEIAAFDYNASALPGWPWQRTGEVFYAWLTPDRAPPGTPLSPVCRFYNSSPIIDSNIFAAVPSECAFIIANYAGTWRLEKRAAFYVILPFSDGTCIGGTLPIYRFFNNRVDANMRHTRDLTVRREMLNKLWAPNGFGDSGVAFCSPV